MKIFKIVLKILIILLLILFLFIGYINIDIWYQVHIKKNINYNLCCCGLSFYKTQEIYAFISLIEGILIIFASITALIGIIKKNKICILIGSIIILIDIIFIIIGLRLMS